jgi:hypothetical protein
MVLFLVDVYGGTVPFSCFLACTLPAVFSYFRCCFSRSLSFLSLSPSVSLSLSLSSFTNKPGFLFSIASLSAFLVGWAFLFRVPSLMLQIIIAIICTSQEGVVIIAAGELRWEREME